MANRKILIIGGVAAGATAAARCRRLCEAAEITILERGQFVSYANCGLPYFISRDIESRQKLFLQTPEGFFNRYNVKVLCNMQALAIDRAAKRVQARGPDGKEDWYPYDKLILAQGGNAVSPNIPGADAPSVFKLWRVGDMDAIHGYIEANSPQSVVVMGGGFVGLEMVEAFKKRGLKTTVVELAPTVMSIMDRGFGRRVAEELQANGVEVYTGVGIKAYHPQDRQVELADGRRVAADMVLFSIGVRPELELAKAAGLTMGTTGSLAVDDRMQTSDPNIFAAGDMVEVHHKVSGRQTRMPLAGPANRQGRIAATNVMGGDMRYHGALGTSVCQIFEATAASTGLNEKAARDAGLNVGVAEIVSNHHAGYYPGAKELTLKVVYNKDDGKLLGAQAFGHAGVEKRIDVLAMALHGGMTVHDLAEADFCYAPPYSSANDPVNMIAFVAGNDCSGFSPLATAAELKAALASPNPPLVLDVRTPAEWNRGHLTGALHIPVDSLRDKWENLPTDRKIYIHCKAGQRAHIALRILAGNNFGGMKNVKNVTGGWNSITAEGDFAIEK